MITLLIVALPIAIQISGVILGKPLKTRPERYLFWISCVGLILYIFGYIISLIGHHIHRKLYAEPFSMGPISEAGSVLLSAGVLLAIIGIGFQIGIGSSRLMKLINKKK